MENTPSSKTGYAILSDHRSQLMGIAMLWIMLYHAFPLTIPVPLLNSIKRNGYCGVDIFIFLSAMGQTLSSLKNPRPYGQTVWKRIARILPLYYFITVPFYLWKLLTGRIALKSVLLSLTFLGYWLNVPDHFNWYIPALLVFYLVQPLVLRAVPKRAVWRNIITVCVIVVSIALCEIFMRVNCTHLLDFFARIPIFWIGVLIGFAIYEKRPLDGKGIFFWALLFVLGALYIYCGQFSSYYYLCRTYGFILTTVPLCLFLCLLMKKLPIPPLLRFLDLVGQCTLELYLINATWFIEFDFFSALLGLSPAAYCLVGLPINLLLGIGLHFLRTSLRKRLSGT